MAKLLGRWLKIYENEIGVFLWTALLLFLIRSSNILFNNFAETAFLKRFGVEYLPIVNAVNSITTFILMGVQAGLMIRFPGSRLLAYTLAVCGFSVAGFRLLVPLRIDLIYPLLYVLKSQYEVLFGLLFWNLANDLFNTRQSKRIFPFITAIGIVGGIIGSFSTPLLAKAISLNNLMFVYLGTTLLAAAAVTRMGNLYPATLLIDKEPKKSKKSSSIINEMKEILPALRESKLLKVLVVIAFAPNVVIPIINYQFSFAVNQAFATEHSMIAFYGYFRGFQNVIALAIILFSGRIYSRFGLPVALMFHPFNYMLAFLAFLLRFDIISAMYARLSTAVLRNAVNAPASAVLMGLLPESKRIIMRSFLRGTVVRVGILLGSGLTLLSQDYMHPRFLSLVALPFVFLWIITILTLKKNYAAILIDLIKGKMLDIKQLASEKASHIFGDKQVKQQLVQSFLASHGEGSVWYARLLQSLGEESLDELILSTFKSQDDPTKLELLPLLSPKAGKQAVQVFFELADPDKPELMIAFARTTQRIYKGMPLKLQKEIFDSARNPEVKAYALIGLYRESPTEYAGLIDQWLRSDRLPERRAGVIAAGETGAARYREYLRDMLHKEDDASILPLILNGLKRLEAPALNELALPFLSHPAEAVRLAALEAFQTESDEDERKVIAMMGDRSEKIRDLAVNKLETSSYLNIDLLIESLGTSGRTVRDGLFKLIKSLDIKDVDRISYFRRAIERGYMDVVESEDLRRLPQSLERDLLITHLDEQRRLRMENVLRGLAVYDNTGRMRIIWRGVSSPDPRRRANSCEALENFVDPAISKLMMPLLEDVPVQERIAAGRKFFDLKELGSDPCKLYNHLLSKPDWVTVVLTLFLASGQDLKQIDEEIIHKIADSEDERIRQALRHIGHDVEPGAGAKERVVDTPLTISEKIQHLREIQVFKGLSVSELAAIASVTEEVEYPVGEMVIREGELGDKMFLVLDGQVAVVKHGKEGEQAQEVELERIGSKGYFGEMSLFEDIQRTASIETTEDSRFLVLDKGDFLEIVKEYPEIPLQICKELSRRIRTLHEKVIHYEKDTL